MKKFKDIPEYNFNVKRHDYRSNDNKLQNYYRSRDNDFNQRRNKFLNNVRSDQYMKRMARRQRSIQKRFKKINNYHHEKLYHFSRNRENRLRNKLNLNHSTLRSLRSRNYLPSPVEKPNLYEDSDRHYDILLETAMENPSGNLLMAKINNLYEKTFYDLFKLNTTNLTNLGIDKLLQNKNNIRSDSNSLRNGLPLNILKENVDQFAR